MPTAPMGSATTSKAASLRPKWCVSRRTHLSPAIRASQSMESRNDKVYKELGLYALKKKIEDAVGRVEMVAPTALGLEEARRIRQEEMLREYNLWDDFARSYESLADLADAMKVVDDLKDLRYKAEEAKLITQLAEKDIINHELFKQAYKASIDVSKFLDRYEMSKLLSGPYDKEGACVTIKAGSEGVASEVWAEKLLRMYTRWAKKHGYKGRVIEKYPSKRCGMRLTTIEFESEYMYGYLFGEKGIHRMICHSLDNSGDFEACTAGVDVIPLFLDGAVDLHIDDTDMEISSSLTCDDEQSGYRTGHSVSIHHIPSGITIQSSGERSHFANKIKALNRLKAKLFVLVAEQGSTDVKRIKKEAAANDLRQEARNYVFRPHKSVHDVKTGIQLPDLNSVLDGNIEPLIRSHISLRQGRELIE
ncbi:peptide chain release factor PrfB3, chloroplastic [Typha latifolia]|uniref:peptide chain release factor PrfB3, chloroplastic n=1 Tax=Typha latifolia TaxID=4733 RepID=UPI003C2CA35E